MKTNDLEAVKFVADWSKWLASIQTAVVTLVGYTSIKGSIYMSGPIQLTLVIAAMISFFISLFCASFILFALPGIIQRLPPPGNQDVLTMGTYNGKGIRLSTFCVGQFIFFVLGVALLISWSATQFWAQIPSLNG